MERRLIFIIMNPAMFLTLVLGFILAFSRPDILAQRWFFFKLVFAGALVIYHYYSVRVYRRFARGDLFLSERALRILNEIPAVVLIVIVILVVVKP
jgi:putative membrane protein